MISLQHLKSCPSLKKIPGQLDFNQELKFCTDTRKYIHPQAFVAIPGAKVNSLDLINHILAEKCPLVVFQDSGENNEKVKQLAQKYPSTVFLPASDSVLFLQELSHLHIQEWKGQRNKNTIFAISGSNGKTTHKEMLSFILKTILPGKIIATEKNNNNHLGVPLTLLEVNKETEMVVLELGSNHPGEIKVLCDIAAPNAGLTTNIGATHLEFFGTEENVFKEEGYLYYAVKEASHENGLFLINCDDAYLKQLPSFKGTVAIGESPLAQARMNLSGDHFELEFQGQKIKLSNLHVTGRHNKSNLLTSVFIAQYFYPEYREKIIEAASEFRPTKNRSEWINFQGLPIYLDAYNANPSSMRAALEGFKESVLARGLNLHEACVVLGDMNELGPQASTYHQEIGQLVKSLGFDQVYFIGKYSHDYCQGFAQGVARPSAREFKEEYRSKILPKHRIHFIKGSRSLQLESLFDIT